jgi:hypothetical protein
LPIFSWMLLFVLLIGMLFLVKVAFSLLLLLVKELVSLLKPYQISWFHLGFPVLDPYGVCFMGCWLERALYILVCYGKLSMDASATVFAVRSYHRLSRGGLVDSSLDCFDVCNILCIIFFCNLVSDPVLGLINAFRFIHRILIWLYFVITYL